MKYKELKIVEVERQIGVPELNEASAAAVATLKDHPGFQYLLAKLNLQRQLLRDTIANQRHKDLKDVEFLQSGVAWCSWLQQQLDKAVAIQNRPQPRKARSSELEAFEALTSQVDWVGASRRPNGRADNGELTAPQALGE